MPALITHDAFGQDTYARLFRTIGGSRDEAEAFLLGNQGPDPLFYVVVSPRLRAFTRLGNKMHSEQPSELLAAFKQSLSVLDEDERSIGTAYALGFLCHYTLDSTMHPLVFAQEYEVCDAGEPGLSRKDGSEVHSVIESELDELVLFAKQGETVATFDPSRSILKASEHVLSVISKMYAYAVLTTYGLTIPAHMFTTAVHDFRRVQHLFHSKSGLKRQALGRVEELARPYSFLRAMSHRPLEITESAFDNRDHRAWSDPFTGEAHTESFWDLYNTALDQAERNIALFADDAFDIEAARKLTGDLDFSGKPTAASPLAHATA